jgi:hypothetical protein
MTEDNRNRMRSRAAPAVLGQTNMFWGCATLRYPYWLERRNRTQARETQAEGERRAAPRPKAKNFGRGRERKESQSEPRCRMNPAREFFSNGRRAVDGHSYPAMQPAATAREEKDRVIIAFTGSRKIGSIACLRRTTSLRPLKPEPDPAMVFPSLKLVAFREAGN